MASPEQQPTGQPEQPGEIQERPDALSLPEQLEQDTGVRTIPHKPTGTTDDQTGQTTAQAVPPDDQTPIVLPADPQQAQAWSQGSGDDSSTWLGFLILRKVKQAIAMGRKIIIGS